MKREKKRLRIFRLKWDVQIILLLPRVSGVFGRETRKIVRTRDGRWLQWNYFRHTTEQMHKWTPRDCERIHKICVSSSQRKSQYGGGVNGHKIILLAKKCFDSFWEMSFLQWSATEYINQNMAQVSCSKLASHHKVAEYFVCF